MAAFVFILNKYFLPDLPKNIPNIKFVKTLPICERNVEHIRPSLFIKR
jgi:hypothetical protein